MEQILNALQILVPLVVKHVLPLVVLILPLYFIVKLITTDEEE